MRGAGSQQAAKLNNMIESRLAESSGRYASMMSEFDTQLKFGTERIDDSKK
jgi:hypothetical protein